MPELTGFAVRPCFQQDLPWARLIYSDSVMRDFGAFETQPPSQDDFDSRWTRIAGAGWPFLVACGAEDASRVLGFAYAAPYDSAPVFAQAFEHRVYVAPSYRRRGIATHLVSALLTQLRGDYVYHLIGRIAADDEASMRLHAKLGFREAGRLNFILFKFGVWRSVTLMHRGLNDPQE